MPIIWIDTPKSCSECYFVSDVKFWEQNGYEFCRYTFKNLENDTDNSIPDDCPLKEGVKE